MSRAEDDVDPMMWTSIGILIVFLLFLLFLDGFGRCFLCF